MINRADFARHYTSQVLWDCYEGMNARCQPFLKRPLRRPIRPDSCSSTCGAGGRVRLGRATVPEGTADLELVSSEGAPDAGGRGGAAGGAGWGGGADATGAGGGGTAACGLGLTMPGGAASETGAPHCSQKSPSKSSGPLQKRQMIAPGWITCLSNDFFSVSSSSSAACSPLPCCGSTVAHERGDITGVGAIFSGTVVVPFCGSPAGGIGAGSKSCGGGAADASAITGSGAATYGGSGGGAASTGVPH